MKTLNYIAVLILAIIFSVSFNSISSGSQQMSECPHCDVSCIETGCCTDHQNSSQGNSQVCGNECTNVKCKESCSVSEGSSMMEAGSINIKNESIVVDAEVVCTDKNNSGTGTNGCCK
ncbi:MAG: hypothetical protein M3P82_02045 [Bacteroidota bacterium]|nr:hypothetical protein [Bacteroidota bacterium]